MGTGIAFAVFGLAALAAPGPGFGINAYVTLYNRTITGDESSSSFSVDVTLKDRKGREKGRYSTVPDGDGRWSIYLLNDVVPEPGDTVRVQHMVDDDEVTLADTSWTVCFSSRGAAAANVVVTLNHPRTGSEQIEVFTGGSARIVP